MFVFITKTQTVHREIWVYSSPAVQYLRFKVPVHNSYIVHVTDGRHQLSHDAAGLCFAEMLLSADPLQQLPSTEQLQDQVRVELQQTHTQNIFTLLTNLCYTHFQPLFFMLWNSRCKHSDPALQTSANIEKCLLTYIKSCFHSLNCK